MTYSAFVGCDLGQANDFTALCVAEEACWVGSEPSSIAESLLWPADARGWVAPSALLPASADYFQRRTRAGHRPDKPPLLVRHLERLRHVSYGVIVQRVADVVRRPPLIERRTALVVDYTGVGRAVFDRLYELGLRPYAVTITGGDHVGGSTAGALSVPKRELVVATQAMLQEGRLRIAAGLEHAATLAQELQEFRVHISPAGHDSYSAREGEHDDLLLAAALACWFREWWNKAYDQRIGRKQERERIEA